MTTNTREAHKVPEPRSRDAEHSRVAILAAARDEFAEYGLGGAQVDRIAERADVNKRLLCDYFDDNDRSFARCWKRPTATSARLNSNCT